MPAPETQHYYDKYSDDTAHLLQNMGDKFKDTMVVKSLEGEGANFINQYGETEAREDDSRRGETPHMDVPRYRRWVFPRTVEWGHLVDQRDVIRTLGDPTQAVQKAGVMAVARKIDLTVIIPAFFATAKTGQNGETDVTFPSSQQVTAATGGGGSATGLNLEKFRAAHEILQINEAPGPDDEGYEQPISIITPKQNRNLLADYQAASKEFQNGVVIMGQYVREVYGTRILVRNGLELNGSTERRCPLYLKSGMGLGLWPLDVAWAKERPDRKGNTQLFNQKVVGATRLEEKKVVELICAE